MKQIQQSLLAAIPPSNQALILAAHCKAYLTSVRPAAVMASKKTQVYTTKINNEQLAKLSFSFSSIGDTKPFLLRSNTQSYFHSHYVF